MKLFDIIEFLVKKKIKFKVIIAGKLDSKIKFLFYKKINKLRKFCKYLGEIDNNKKKKFFKKITYFTFPTEYKHEAYPMVICESLFYGVPVITNNIGSISSLVNNKNGILSKRNDLLSNRILNTVANFNIQNYKNKSNNCLKLITKKIDQSEKQLIRFENLIKI